MIGNDDARYGVPRRRGAQRADSPVVTVGTTNSSTRWQNKMIVDETPHTEGMTTKKQTDDDADDEHDHHGHTPRYR